MGCFCINILVLLLEIDIIYNNKIFYYYILLLFESHSLTYLRTIVLNAFSKIEYLLLFKVSFSVVHGVYCLSPATPL